MLGPITFDEAVIKRVPQRDATSHWIFTIWGNPVCWVAQPSMEKLRGLFWGAWGSQLNQELSVAYDLMLPQLFTTSVFPLVFKVRFIFAPLV